MNRIPIPFIEPDAPPVFPPPERALREPDGLLAVGGDLSPERLLAAYRHGIFPWYGEGDPILWWSPDPRCVFDTGAVHVSRSLRRQIRRSTWTWTLDRAFDAVIEACAAPRDYESGTWIVPSMQAAYRRLHRLGHAHSIEIWDDARLVGGLYGVAAGRLFCGESMFSAQSGGSKIALVGMCRWLHAHGVPLLDAQVTNDHLLRMGAREMPRAKFLAQVADLVDRPTDELWQFPSASRPVASLLD